MIKKNNIFSYKRELYAFILFLVSVFLFISLFTYSCEDDSFLYMSTESHPITNACGLFGSYAASLLLYFFGCTSYILIIFVLFCAYACAFNAIQQEIDRVVAGVVFLFSSAALCASTKLVYIKNISAGGVLGSYIYAFLFSMLDAIGANIILIGLWCASLVILFRLSILSIMLFVGKKCAFILSIIFSRFVSHNFLNDARACAYNFYRRMYLVGEHILQVKFTIQPKKILLEYEQNELHDTIVDIISQDAFWHEFTHAAGSDYVHSAFSKEKNDSYEHVPSHKEILISDYLKPTSSLFTITVEDDEHQLKNGHQEQQERVKILEEKLAHFDIKGSVVSINRGPVITLFEYQPHIDIKVSKILALEHDLALALQATSIRILAPIPGKSVVGFEVANRNRKKVSFVKLLTSVEFEKTRGSLPVILGEDIVGKPYFVDLLSLPHVLIAGSTGSGKSVALNGILMSLLYKIAPSDCKLILIDPKRLEFAAYAGIPHLLVPPVTQPRQATLILQWLVHEMERRYELLAESGVKNITDYHLLKKSELPFIVVVIDELADLMMVAGREIEDLIVRLAQMARAAGIHLVVATQRPSVDVITGLIKVNFPSRVALRVTSATDSRTILDCSGAEKLVGKGDMLFLEAQSASLKRVHGAYVTDADIQALVSYIRKQKQPHYLSDDELFINKKKEQECDDDIYQDVLMFLQEVDEISISLLQRKFRIGYNRSARIIEMLESQGRIMPADSGKTRKVIR